MAEPSAFYANSLVLIQCTVQLTATSGDAEADFSQQQYTAQTVFFSFTLRNKMDKDDTNHCCCKATSHNNCIVPIAFK